MLWSYISVVAPTIAIINSVIAVAVTQFPPGKEGWKLALLVTAIVLGCLAAAATILAQHHTNKKQKQESEKRSSIHEQLGRFIETGNVFLKMLRDPTQPMVGDAVDTWAGAVEAYLAEHLGQGYVPRFRDASGLLHGQPMGIDETRLSYWNGVYERVTRLQQFSVEISK